jgi:hypothetical protein
VSNATSATRLIHDQPENQDGFPQRQPRRRAAEGGPHQECAAVTWRSNIRR